MVPIFIAYFDVAALQSSHQRSLYSVLESHFFSQMAHAIDRKLKSRLMKALENENGQTELQLIEKLIEDGKDIDFTW